MGLSAGDIQAIVERVKAALLSAQTTVKAVTPTPPPDTAAKSVVPLRLVTEADVLQAKEQAQSNIVTIVKPIVTPLAKDLLRESGIELVTERTQNSVSSSESSSERQKRKIAIGCDSAGEAFVKPVTNLLIKDGFQITKIAVSGPKDLNEESAKAVAEAIQSGKCRFGIMLDGLGMASAVVGNSNGVIAAACWDTATARFARSRMDAKMLCLGVEVISPTMLLDIVKTFLQDAKIKPDTSL